MLFCTPTLCEAPATSEVMYCVINNGGRERLTVGGGRSNVSLPGGTHIMAGRFEATMETNSASSAFLRRDADPGCEQYSRCRTGHPIVCRHRHRHRHDHHYNRRHQHHDTSMAITVFNMRTYYHHHRQKRRLYLNKQTMTDNSGYMHIHVTEV